MQIVVPVSYTHLDVYKRQVYDIDDLQQAVSSHVADRRKEAEKAEAIVNGEVEKFHVRLQTLDVLSLIHI